MISIIHPSRNRIKKSKATLYDWTRMAKGRPFELIVSIDSDDPQKDDYKSWYTDKVIVNKNRSAVDAINNAAKVATGNVFIVVSDDTEAIENWDVFIEDHAKNDNDWILKTQDGIQPWLITMPVLDRAYYNRFGYIYYPGYQHMFCDTELTCVADITGRKITSNLLFPHKHYSVTKEQPDEINKKADATWAQGEKLFLERYKRNFDLPKGGKIQDKGMIDWLQRKVR